jgi:hypothetical protein
MHFIFADDSRQTRLSRLGMGPLVAIAGVQVPDATVGSLEQDLDQLCIDASFPPGEEFKWSPRRDSWMFSNLHAPERDWFFLGALTMAGKCGATVTVVAADARYARGKDEHELRSRRHNVIP